MFLRLRPVGILLIWIASLIISSSAICAEDKPAEPAKSEPPKKEEKKPEETPAKKPKMKKYDEVITTNAVTKIGLFRVHRIEESIYYEIPGDALDTDLLWVIQISETTAGSSYAGMPVGDRVVRWELRGDQVLLRDVRYGIRADTSDPISRAVKASNLAPIIRAFEVKAFGKDKAPVIDVTEIFRKDVPEFSPRRALSAGAIDDKRTFIEEFKAFPRNINVRVLASFAPGKQAGGGEDGPQTSGITAVICHSMVKLPETPMKPRRFDSRVGFFTESFTDYANRDDHAAETV